MVVELLKDFNYSTLSPEPKQAWLQIFRHAVQEFHAQVDSSRGPATQDQLIRLTEVLEGAAKELKVMISWDYIKKFARSGQASQRVEVIPMLEKQALLLEHTVAAIEVKSKIRTALQSEKVEKPANDILEISNRTLVEIHPRLSALRAAISQAEMPEAKQTKLLKILNDFEIALNSRKISRLNSFAMLALVGAGLTGTTTVLADGPDALNTIGEITSLIGAEIESEEDAKLISDQTKEVAQLPSPDNSDPAPKPTRK